MSRISVLKVAVVGIAVLLALNLSVLTLAVVMLGTRLGGAPAQSRADIAQVTTATIRAHPELVREALMALIKKPGGGAAAPRGGETHIDRTAAIAANVAALLNSPHQTVLGDPAGKVTLVEFFDYNCGFCRRAVPDTMALLKTDPKLRVVLKEFPILGPNSVDAAHIAIALRMQDPRGVKYAQFHELLLSGGVADKAQALVIAKQVGADMTRLNRDADSSEVKATLEENAKLASALGINGTPTYVLGNELVVGAVGQTNLEARIAALRAKAERVR